MRLQNLCHDTEPEQGAQVAGLRRYYSSVLSLITCFPSNTVTLIVTVPQPKSLLYSISTVAPHRSFVADMHFLYSEISPPSNCFFGIGSSTRAWCLRFVGCCRSSSHQKLPSSDQHMRPNPSHDLTMQPWSQPPSVSFSCSRSWLLSLISVMNTTPTSSLIDTFLLNQWINT